MYKSTRYRYSKSDLLVLSSKIGEFLSKKSKAVEYPLYTEIQNQEVVKKVLKLLAGYSQVPFEPEEILQAFPLVIELGMNAEVNIADEGFEPNTQFQEIFWKRHVLGIMNEKNCYIILNHYHAADNNFKEKQKDSLDDILAIISTNGYTAFSDPARLQELSADSFKTVLQWYLDSLNKKGLAPEESPDGFNLLEIAMKVCSIKVPTKEREKYLKDIKAMIDKAKPLMEIPEEIK